MVGSTHKSLPPRLRGFPMNRSYKILWLFIFVYGAFQVWDWNFWIEHKCKIATKLLWIVYICVRTIKIKYRVHHWTCSLSISFMIILCECRMYIKWHPYVKIFRRIHTCFYSSFYLHNPHRWLLHSKNTSKSIYVIILHDPCVYSIARRRQQWANVWSVTE